MKTLLISHIFLISISLKGSCGYPTINLDDCPTDCICYSDYLHNLESWRWVKPDILYDRDDPEHESFNPYTEHNEVYENPKLHRKRQRETKLLTVTCMLRHNGSENLGKVFDFIPRETQVLSLIQAPGSGSISIGKELFRRFHSLVGLEIKGYNVKEDLIEITGDCLSDLVSLTYLNLETLLLQQSLVENNLHDSTSRMMRLNYTFNDIATNEITSQLLIISPDKDTSEGSDSVVSYSEYRESLQKEKTAPLDPKFRVAFTGLPKLQHLKISDCNLHDISWDMFYKLGNLKYLLLDENDLLFLPDFVFYATTNLTTLSLANNRILNLQTVGLAGLLYLQKLDVTYNNITHLSELSLPPFPLLEVADFRYNPIDSIFPNTFEIMNSTKMLYLGSPTTPLDLSPNSFYGLVSLTKLDIINVKIRLLEKTMLKGMPSLKTLVMTGEIPRISYDAFGEVTQLERLTLRECALRKISMDAFFGLSSLLELDLSHNAISFLPPGIFEDQVSLREVFLQHNQLTTLPANLIQNLPVKMIRLEGNPWHCSCDMMSWNSQQTNRVKRYHIPPPNNTLCQKIYDKGSMCFETYEPKFEVTYSYEKRVSPVCETPIRYKDRSVFQVLRKELRKCVTALDTSADVPGSKKKSNKENSPTEDPAALFPENYSIDTLTALENQLMPKPVKVKKNRTRDNTNQTSESHLSNIISQLSPFEVQTSPVQSGHISPALTNHDDSSSAPFNTLQPIPENKGIQFTEQSIADGNAKLKNMVSQVHSELASKFSFERSPQIPTTSIDPDKLARKLERQRKKNKQRQASAQREQNNMPNTHNGDLTLAFSKKSMKLARSQQRPST